MAQINQFTNEQGAQFVDNSHSIITVSPEGTKISQTFHSEEKKKGGASDTFTGKPFGEDALDSESEGANAGQLSNRQVVIMMAGLLDISLSPDFTNQKQLAQFLSRLTGRSKESIRQTIMQLAKDGIETPQARKDSIVAADVLEPVCKRVAGRLRNDAEE